MSDDTPILAITGGPHSGKTTIRTRLIEHFTALGYAVEFLPEVATQLIEEGNGPDVVGIVEFQRHVLTRSIAQEDAAHEKMRLVEGKKIIFADRGVMDGAAYVESHEIRAIWDEFGYHIVELRDDRYDGVIFLESTAVGLPQLYSCENNPARYEKTAEEAAATDRRTLAVWIGTPHLAYIDNSSDFEGKISRAIAWAEYFVADEENEYKYKLLVPFDRSMLPGHAQRIDIRQSYIRVPGAVKNHRIRARGQEDGFIYRQTQKLSRSDLSCQEIERRITAVDFAHLHGTCGAPDHEEVVKYRWCFVENGYYWELDVFRDWDEDVLLEVEIPDPSWDVTLPRSFKGKVIDVTGDRAYMNKAIAKKIAARKKKAA